MNSIEKLENLTALAKTQSERLYQKNVKNAATKLRATMQEIKAVAQTIRKEALEHQHAMPTKKRGGGAAASTEEADAADEE